MLFLIYQVFNLIVVYRLDYLFGVSYFCFFK